MMSPGRIDKLLSAENHELASLITRVRQLDRYSRRLRQLLPSPLCEHCRVADIRENKLIVGVDNAVWATKLRFYVPSLLPQLQQSHQELAGITRIKVLILQATSIPGSEQPQKHSLQLSSENAAQLNSLAETIDDEHLRAALQRLASHVAKDK
jgi:hypothetical protein